MTFVGQPERATQNRVVALFRDGNSNVEETLLTAWLTRSGSTLAQISAALYRLCTEADNHSRSLLALAAGHRVLEQDVDPAAATSPAITPRLRRRRRPTRAFSTAASPPRAAPPTRGGCAGGAAARRRSGATTSTAPSTRTPGSPQVPPERLPKERHPIEIFGVEIAHRERPVDLGRLFMARFGEIARIEARGDKVRVTLKSGTVFDLDRFEPATSTTACGCGTAGRASSTSTVCGSARSSSSPPPGSAPPPTGCTGPCARGRATSPASSSGTGRSASALTRSTATPPAVSFGLVASIVPPGREERGAQRARVTLQNGEELQLERTGDLGERNAGMLIFVDGRQRPEYVPWTDVEQVDFDRPPAMYP